MLISSCVSSEPPGQRDIQDSQIHKLSYFGEKRHQWTLDAALTHSICSRPVCQLCREIRSGCSKAQCVNPVMSKLFHYCSWQIRQLLSSNTELQLHLKGVWIKTDYLGSDSALSLLSPQWNLVRFKRAASNRGFGETKIWKLFKQMKLSKADALVHVIWDSVGCEGSRGMKYCRREEISSEREWWSVFSPGAADIFMN